MSTRHIRKLYGTTLLPPPSESSDEEYEPLYVKNAMQSKFEGLVLSSDSSESEQVEPEVSDIEENENPKAKTKAKKNKKRRKGKNIHVKSKDFEQLDEIDKCLKEVNDMLGEPTAPEPIQEKPIDPAVVLLSISPKYLNYEDELTRLFGPEEDDFGRRKRQNRRTWLQKARIIHMPENVVRFRCKGLSMVLQRTEGDCKYFTFNHTSEYQKKFRLLLYRFNSRFGHMPNMNEMDIEGNKLTVEGMIENADMLFQYEEYNAAIKSIERCISVMESVAHPCFSLTDMRTRLEYKYLENRVFYVAVLKYLHLLTNKACHRTALELAKMLLNLDPTDPLALLFIIDTLAIRAREHRWLIDIVDYWATDRDAGYLFNIQYSYAMAHFHVATKNKEDLTKANELIQTAMLTYPTVVVKILECANIPNTQIQTHELFTTFSEKKMARDLKVLFTLYAKFTWSRWREANVLNWLVKNALELIQKFDTDPNVKERANSLADCRITLFRKFPVGVVRHLCVIKPMADLLIDGGVPDFLHNLPSNPAPEVENGIDRYNYYRRRNIPASAHPALLLTSFISSIMPEYEGLNDPSFMEDIDRYLTYISRDANILRTEFIEPPAGVVSVINARRDSNIRAIGEADSGTNDYADRSADGDTEGGANGEEVQSGVNTGIDSNATGDADGSADNQNSTDGVNSYTDTSDDDDDFDLMDSRNLNLSIPVEMLREIFGDAFLNDILYPSVEEAELYQYMDMDNFEFDSDV